MIVTKLDHLRVHVLRRARIFRATLFANPLSSVAHVHAKSATQPDGVAGALVPVIAGGSGGSAPIFQRHAAEAVAGECDYDQ